MAVFTRIADDSSTLRSRVLDSLFWLSAARVAGQFINWLVTIWVIRILSPEDYGLMAMAMVFISAFSLLHEFGLGPALTRSPNLDEMALRKAFGIVLVSNALLFWVLLLGAPLVAWFYGSEELTPLVRLLAMQFIGMSFAVVPRSLMEGRLEFRKVAFGDLIANLSGTLVTLILALHGYGVWALTVGVVTISFLRAGIFNLLCPCPGLPIFSLRGMHEFLKFGGAITLERILWFIYHQADVLIAGKLLGKEALGFYAVGKSIAALPSDKLSPIIQQIALPAFARIQSDRDRVGNSLIACVNALGVFACPVFFGICAVGLDLMTTLLGEKWAPAALPLKTYSLILPLGMISGLLLSALKAIGRADVSLKNVAFGSLLMTTAFMVGSRWDLTGLSLAWVVAYPLYFLITLIRSSPVLGTTPSVLAAKVSRPMAASVVMLVSVFILGRMIGEALPHGPARLTVLALIGASVYGAGMLTFGHKSLTDAVALIRRNRSSS